MLIFICWNNYLLVSCFPYEVRFSEVMKVSVFGVNEDMVGYVNLDLLGHN